MFTALLTVLLDDATDFAVALALLSARAASGSARVIVAEEISELGLASPLMSFFAPLGRDGRAGPAAADGFLVPGDTPALVAPLLLADEPESPACCGTADATAAPLAMAAPTPIVRAPAPSHADTWGWSLLARRRSFARWAFALARFAVRCPAAMPAPLRFVPLLVGTGVNPGRTDSSTVGGVVLATVVDLSSGCRAPDGSGRDYCNFRQRQSPTTAFGHVGSSVAGTIAARGTRSARRSAGAGSARVAVDADVPRNAIGVATVAVADGATLTAGAAAAPDTASARRAAGATRADSAEHATAAAGPTGSARTAGSTRAADTTGAAISGIATVTDAVQDGVAVVCTDVAAPTAGPTGSSGSAGAARPAGSAGPTASQEQCAIAARSAGSTRGTRAAGGAGASDAAGARIAADPLAVGIRKKAPALAISGGDVAARPAGSAAWAARPTGSGVTTVSDPKPAGSVGVADASASTTDPTTGAAIATVRRRCRRRRCR